MTFLEDTEAFLGTGEKNRKGESLDAFLESYNPYKHLTPSVTTDAVVFSYRNDPGYALKEGGISLLLVKRSNHPDIGFWALPGGFVNMKEDLFSGAKRELYEETGVKDVPMESFAVRGDYKRDPRTRIITACFLALTQEDNLQIRAGDDAAEAALFRVSCEVERKSGEEKSYHLSLYNAERHLKLESLVTEKISSGLIREKRYTVEDKGQIAMDHAGIICEAFALLKGRMKNEETY